MKLQELAKPQQTKTAQVFESYFGKTINFDSLSKKQANGMLSRVRGLIREHRRQPEFHVSERNPAYLKLIMLEQALAQKITVRTKRQLRESEIQQAQVVLAAQDMVDRMQKMIEEVTALQFKDLPALVDQIKNEVGVDQSMQFNQDATAALGGLVQNLQGYKQQLEQALGVVTGQGAAEIPGMDSGAPTAEEPPMDDLNIDATGPEGDMDINAEVEPEELGGKAPPQSLGRGRR